MHQYQNCCITSKVKTPPNQTDLNSNCILHPIKSYAVQLPDQLKAAHF